MTVIQPNSISGINSITVQSGEALSIHKSDGSVLREIVDNTGVSTFHSIKVGTAVSIHNNGNLGITGILTAASYVGDGSALTGIAGTEITGSDFAVGVSTFFVDYENNRVGIGTIVPDRSLTVYKDAVARLNIKALNNSNTGIEFGDQDDQNAGYIAYDNTDNSFAVGLNGTGEKISIDSNGNVSLASSLAVTGLCTAANFIPTEGQLANRNVIINGAMKVAQRGTSEASVNSQQYADAPDRFKFKPNGTVAFTLSQSTSSPNGFGFSYGFECSTANASPGAGDYVWFEQRLEGFDVQRFKKGTSDALQFALSFYVKTNESGVYAVELDDEDNTRKVSGTFTVSDGNWNRHTIIFPADTTGAFGDDSGRSLVVRWWLLAGSNYTSGSLNSTWGAPADATRAVGQTGNVAADTSSEFYITGVQLEAGPAVTPFEHLNYTQDLVRCQRYYYRETIANNDFFTGMGMADVDGNTVILNLPFPVTMRQEPSLEQTGTAGNYMIRRSTTQQCTSAPSLGSASTPYQASVSFVKSSHGWGDGSAVRCGAWGTSYLGFDAEI